jgi:Na+-translocating ferredoxin:NAD+ oxidoreductase subunit A
MNILKIIFLAVLVNNVVLTRFIGVPVPDGSLKDYFSLHRSIAVLIVLLIVNILSFYIIDYILKPYQLQFLQTIVFVILTIAVLAIAEVVLRKSNLKIIKGKAVSVSLIMTNSIILGVCLISFEREASVSLSDTIIYTFSSVVGYILVMTMISGIFQQMRLTGVPKSMKGIPISLITIGILALAFIGLTGIFR